MSDMVKGYKVFNSEWTCKNKKYTCPGRFKEDVELEICGHGMHFCLNAADCFQYYNFDQNNHVAEVIAHGQVVYGDNKCCTDDLEIVREIPWDEVLRIINTGKECTGLGNTGDCNTGDRNTGDRNAGNWNAGDRNAGNRNTGERNTGNWNAGSSNTGNWNAGNRNAGDWNAGNSNTGSSNTGDCNTGNRNTGSCNTGDWNTGNWNARNRNTGNCNTGNWNAGDCNTGNRNTGDWNTGDWNTGDWDKSSFETGCFNTKERKIFLFDRPSDWLYWDWLQSRARQMLNQIPKNVVEWVNSEDMTDEEKAVNSTYKTTGGYLKVLDESECSQIWWDGLTDEEKRIIKAIPNYDKETFEEITGIKTE